VMQGVSSRSGVPWLRGCGCDPRLLRGQEHRGRRAVARRWALGRRFPGGPPMARIAALTIAAGRYVGAGFGLSSPGTPASIAVCVHGAGLVPVPGVPGLLNRDTCGARIWQRLCPRHTIQYTARSANVSFKLPMRG
jgi:hypothetical protein